jgi:hypothetical protein
MSHPSTRDCAIVTPAEAIDAFQRSPGAGALMAEYDMRVRWPVTAVAATLLVAGPYAVAAAQRSFYPGLQGRLTRAQPLNADEIAELLQASREALAYKSLRLSRSPTGVPGAEYLIGPDGRPVMIRAASDRPDWRAFTPGPRLEFQRDAIVITNYTRRAALHCDGVLSAEEMVVEYRSAGDGWTVTARLADPIELGATVFAVLTGEASLADGGRRHIQQRQARGLSGAWPPTGTAQTLWIDEITLVPLLWQVAATQDPPAADEGLYFVYDRSIDIRPPSNVAAPECLP